MTSKPMKQQWEERLRKVDVTNYCELERFITSLLSQAKAERTEEILDLIDCEIDCESTAGYQTVWGYNLKKRISSLHLKESES